MTKNNGFIERRRWDRFRVNDTVRVDFTKSRIFSLIMPSATKSAVVIDISRGGISFIYESDQIWSTRFSRLSIAANDNGIAVQDLPYEVVSDYRISSYHEAAHARRCGIRFGELSPAQKSQLDTFINSFKMEPKVTYRETAENRIKSDDRQSKGHEKRSAAGTEEQIQHGSGY